VPDPSTKSLDALQPVHMERLQLMEFVNGI
jgi:hypothetical protein